MKRLLSIAALAFLFAACGNQPVIQEIKPDTAAPGAVVEVIGSNFGAEQGKGFLQIGALFIARENVLAWSAESVKMRVPVTAPVGKSFIQLTIDNGTPSNKKTFTVAEAAGSGGETIVVADRSTPGVALYDLSDPAAVKSVASVDLSLAGYDTTVNGLAVAADQQKIFVSLTGTSGAGDETSKLVVLGGVGAAITSPTLVDVGVQPTGLAVSPAGNRVYVAATASGMLTVVNAVDDSVIEDLAVDLAAVSYGFEPLQVEAFANPNSAVTGDWVAVAGNNWFLGRAEVVTYAPGTTQPIVSVVAIENFEIQAPVAVSAPAGIAWVAGLAGGAPALATLDLAAGQLVGVAVIGQDLALAGFSSATAVSDVEFDAVTKTLYLALPGAGVAKIAAGAAEGTLIAVDDPLRLEVLNDAARAVVVTRPAAGAVARIASDGSVTADFVQTAPEPFEVREFPTLQP